MVHELRILQTQELRSFCCLAARITSCFIEQVPIWKVARIKISVWPAQPTSGSISAQRNLYNQWQRQLPSSVVLALGLFIGQVVILT